MSYQNQSSQDLPFYNQWKESVLTKASVYGLPAELVENSSVKTIYDIRAELENVI